MSERPVPQVYTHGTKLERKAATDRTLIPIVAAYENWKTASLAVRIRDYDSVVQLAKLLNEYKDAVEPSLDSRPNSAQEVLQPSILEEFLEYLFCTLADDVSEVPIRRPAAAYTDLSFNPKSFDSLRSRPEFTISSKDHDFVIGASLTISVCAAGSTDQSQHGIIIPAVALECKRYLERNMLDECSGTAERIKRATPYCLYMVLAEFLKMDDCSPELSRIDEVYILRKQKNSERSDASFRAKPIDPDLVWDMYQACLKHVRRIWWDPESALVTGKVFNYPR